MPGRFFPVNYLARQPVGVAIAAAAGGPGAPKVPAADELADWAVDMYNLDVTTAADLGFPVGAVGGSAGVQVLIFESSKYEDVIDGDIVKRYGVAIRAVVLVEGIKLDASLNLAVVAAKVQLNEASASAQLIVRGYKGDLANLLPRWQHFGVDEYTEYVKSISDIQAKVMGDPGNIVPELLAETDASAVTPSAEMAIGTAYGLDAIARGKDLLTALAGLGQEEPRLSNAVRATYAARVGGDDRSKPTPDVANAAKQDLGAIRVGRGFF